MSRFRGTGPRSGLTTATPEIDVAVPRNRSEAHSLAGLPVQIQFRGRGPPVLIGNRTPAPDGDRLAEDELIELSE